MEAFPNSSFDQFENSFASKQEIDLRWTNLNVFIAQKGKAPKIPNVKKLAKLSKTSPINDSGPLLHDQSREIESISTENNLSQFKQILHNQTGYAAHGETLAIMGPSGAGKTTLLSVLTARFTPSKNKRLSGKVQANGQSYNNLDFTSFGVFVMQNDLLFPCLTVRETLLFAAQMRLRGSEEMKERKVDKLIKNLQLESCQDTYIGSALIKGISGGERKRACIGVELVADPIVIIMDEPTSGLDSFTAYNLMVLIRDLAKKEKKCIILSIHSPSYDIFQLIDRLLLLQNGQIVYQGQTRDIIPYIQRLGQKVPEYQNICDFFMYEITINSPKSVLNHINFETNQRDKLNLEIYKNSPNYQGFIRRSTKNSFSYQFGILLIRSYKNYVRNPQLIGSRIFITVFLTTFYAFLYWNVGGNEPPNPATISQSVEVDNYIVTTQGVLFNVGASCFYQAIGPVVSVFPRERSIFLKEETSQIYQVVPYFLAKVLVEIWFIFAQPMVSGTVYYLVFRFPYQLETYVKFCKISLLFLELLCIMMAWCGNGMGLLSGCIFPDINKSAAIAPLIYQPLQVFSGLYENFSNMISYLTFFQWLSPFKYTFEGFTQIFLTGKKFIILNDDGTVLNTLEPIKQLSLSLSYWQSLYGLFLLGLLYHVLALFFLRLLIRKLKA